MFLTHRGKFLLFKWVFRNEAVPATFALVLVRATPAPAVTTNTLSQLGELPNGNGYTTGGIAFPRNATSFDVLTQEDAESRAVMQLKDAAWTASGGILPVSGLGARYAVLVDDAGDPNVVAYWPLDTEVVLADTKTVTVQDLEMRLTQS